MNDDPEYQARVRRHVEEEKTARIGNACSRMIAAHEMLSAAATDLVLAGETSSLTAVARMADDAMSLARELGDRYVKRHGG
jgi:hypothetical protein